MRREARRRGGGGERPSDDARAAERDALAVADDLAPLLDALGISYRRGDGGRKLLARCPSPDHDDRSPSWFVANDPGDPRFGTHACASCGFAGGPAHLAARSEGGVGSWEAASDLLRRLFLVGYDLGTVLDRSARRRVRSSTPFVGYDLDALGFVPIEGTPGEAYLAARGVSRIGMFVLGARWAPRGTKIPRENDEPLDFGGRAILPVTSGGAVEQFAARSVDGREPKYLYAPSPTEGCVWGLDLWPIAERTVAVCEGILTAWGVRAVVGLPSVAVLRSRMSGLQAARIRSAASVVVVADGDDAGEKLVADVRDRLPSVADVRVARLPRGRDAGDALLPIGNPGRVTPETLRRLVDEAVPLRGAPRFEVVVRYGRRGALAGRSRAG